MESKINLINGNFITLDDSCPKAEIISLNNGKITAINASDHNCRNIDLKLFVSRTYKFFHYNHFL